MRVIVALCLLLSCSYVLADEQIQFDLPFDQLHLVSEDFPIIASFQYARVSSPVLVFSLNTNKFAGALEDYVTQEDHKFTFSSNGVTGSFASESSPASTNVVNVSLLCVGILSLVCFQQHRKTSIFLFVLFAMYYAYAVTVYHEYHVVIQIPVGSPSPFRALQIESSGGSFESIVAFSDLREIDIDLCGAGESHIFMEEFDASQTVQMCADSIQLRGVFSGELTGSLRSDNLIIFMENRYSGTLTIQSDTSVVMGADYCQQSNDAYSCGGDSGVLILDSRDIIIEIIRPSATPSNTSSPEPSFDAPSRPPVPSASASNQANPSASASPGIPSIPIGASPSPSALPSIPIDASASSAVDPSASSAANPSVSASSASNPSASASSAANPSASASSAASPSATPSSAPPDPDHFPISASGEFLQMVRLDIVRPTNGENPVVARSYNGNPWEAKPDNDFPPVTFDCSFGTECALLTPGVYEVQVVDIPSYLLNPSLEALWSRFMLQSTFGVTKDELDSLVQTYGANYEDWVSDQINSVPATLHRPYFRARTNPRRLSNTNEATLFKPCEIGSRYQRNAFNQVDEGKTLTISNSEVAGKLTLRVDTQLRTEVDDFLGINATSPVTFPIEYTICLVSDIVNGTIHLDNGTSLCSIQYLNPIISFSSLDSSFMKDIPLASATFVPVRNMPDAMVLQEISTTCDELPSINAFIRYDSQYYRFDARLKLLRNSLAEPVQVDLSEISSTCPSVRRNFLNEEFCIPSHTCSPVTFDGTPVLLEEDNLRAWYLDDRFYVYEILDLRLESPYDVSACTGRSRWKRLGAGSCPFPTTFADQQTMDTFVDALTNSNDPNPYVRDIILQGTNCTDDGSTIGAQVEAGGECFEHVHPDLHSVYDFTLWTIFHDGNEPAAEAGRPNPIAKWAEEGNTYLRFPDWHSMNRWSIRQEYFSFVGRRGDSIPFNSLQTDLQTMSMAERVGAISIGTEDGVEACGSPNEFENQPELGDKYHFSDNIPAADRNHWIDTTDYSSRNAKQKVWLNAILSGNDHLRQRVAWAISQIIPVSEEDLGNPERTESWTNYYDIFVRNAFGNYRDILREVSFNHLMSRYLSFYRNRGFSNSGTYPDENYAREIMQLFSVGLWKLNEDGTIALDGEGNPIATYSNDDILDFARLWTGFDVELYRGNIEPYGTDNGIDPQQVKVDWRDYLPKAKLDAGYLGDAYPLCNELPQHHWLKPGAHFRLTGSASEEGETMDKEEPDEAGYVGRFAPPPTSELYQALCAPSGGECTFPPEVVLNRTLACDNSSIECQVQVVTTIKIYDQTANVTKYYTYTSVPCVKLSFFDNGQLTAYNRDRLQCAPPKQPVAVPICCTANRPNNPVNNISNQTCLVTKELMDYQTAVNRCADAGYSVCNTTWGASWTSSCQSAAFQWVNQTCNLQVQIFPSGRISIVDPLSAENNHPTFAILRENGTNLFRVRWDNNEFPQANNNCIPGCRRVTTLLGDTCVCDITVSDTVAFTDVNTLPDKDQVLSQLFQGSVEPMLYDDRSYTLCSQCSQPGYQVWTTTPDVLDENSIFEVTPSLAGGKTLYLFNRESIVSVGSHSFRNPPRFLVGAGDIQYYWTEWNPISLKTPAAKWEVEALLDHLFEHESTGPFIAYRLIQRLVTSNPSPRYMKTVVDAFRTGTYNGEVFSGKYGDLAATITAIVLDREARTPMLEADPTFGVIKEPLVRVVQVLSSLDFRTINGDEFTISRNLVDIIGMEAYRSPSVFGFYLPENRPEGPLNDLGMVSPEAQLTITPNLFGLLNGFMSLVEYGYSRCAFADSDRWCGTRPDTDQIQALANYMPNNLTDVQQVIDELDLLFTGQRLNPSFKQHIINQYTATMISDSPEAAFTLAQKLILLSPEFHVTSAHQESEQVREPTEDVPSQGRPYKAIVVLIEDGGVDSYNLIVPHSNCVGKDYYAEYNLVREGAAIALGELLPISVPSGTQPCDTFGVHPGFPNLKNSYDNGEALFIANMGALVEPITKDDYFARPVVKDLPPSLFAHNIMSRSTQNLHPQNTAAAGVLGRAVESLRNQSIPYSSELYSLIGATKILDGGDPEFITTGGVIQFNDYAELIGDINNMTASVSESPMAETYLSLLTNSLNSTEELGTLLDGVTLNQTFPTSYIGRQMQQVAKFITLRDQLNTERDVFVVRSGGFDTHATFDLGSLFTPIDDALETFKQEMISENIWDSVTVVAISEFGRTLTSNGAGTDHGWGGNYFVLGGSVDGGKILGEYPDTLTEEGDVHIGRGRLLPTTSWEAIWGGLLQWFGVEQAAIEEVLPNLSKFPPSDLFSQSDLFQ